MTLKKLIVICSLLVLGGCSATSLRCGVDDDSTYLEIYSIPQDLGPFSRNVADMCGFAYEKVELNIIDEVQ